MKCIWCNRAMEGGTGLPVKFDYSPGRYACSEGCREKYNTFALYVYCNRWRFIALVLAVSAVGIVITFLNMKTDHGAFGTFIVFSGLGAVIRKYPFTTPQFVEDHGGEHAVRFAKRVSIYFILLGPIVGLLLYLL